MTTDYDSELKRLQDMALDHAIQEMDASDGLGVETPKDRGDRGFLTGMAAKSLGVAVAIERFMALRRGEGGTADPAAEDATQEAEAKKRLIAKANEQVDKIMERAGVGFHKRGK